ncbi:MAG: phosphoribosyl-ATP diphosphatase [Balneola sp.]|nr:MAG: phosphoribosyl-ATP diphosphatase [Balneola sp.]
MGVNKPLTDKDLEFLRELEDLLYERKDEMPKGSYTTTMFRKGLDKIAQKVGEEAVETVIASKNKGKKETIEEASDLLFHLMLLLAEKKIPFHKVVKTLRKRHDKGNHKHIGE